MPQSSNDLYFHVGHEHTLHRGLIFAAWFNVVEIVVDEDITIVSQILHASKLSVQNFSKFFQTSLNINFDFTQALEQVATVWFDEVYVELSLLNTWLR